MKKILTGLVIGCLLIVVFGIVASGRPVENELMVVDNPFRIDDDADLGAEADSGAGTFDDPWIIENREIDGFGENYGMYIGNTTEYFVVRNCTINGTSIGASHPYYVSSGIHLYNADHGNISNNSIYDCLTYGIYVSNNSYNISLYDNTLWENIGRGIAVFYSDLIYTISNTIYGNQTTNHGITMDGYSDHQYISNNYIHETITIGIGFNDSWNVTIINNEIIGNLTLVPDPAGFPAWGIYVHFSYWVNIESNTITDCVNGIFQTGSHGSESWNNTITENTLDGCWYTGITISYSQNSTISNNDLDNSNPEVDGALDFGIVIYQWVNNTIVYNNYVDDYGTGINITTANHTNVTIYNNHLANTINAWSEANISSVKFNTTIGNYWDDWIIPDVNPRDGIIDYARSIPGSGDNYDAYPLVILTDLEADGALGGSGGGAYSPPPDTDIEPAPPVTGEDTICGSLYIVGFGLVAVLIRKRKQYLV